jgi:hypothetical protein
LVAERVTQLQPPRYTEDEKRRIVEFFMALRLPEIRNFLRRRELPVSGPKAQIRERIETALMDDMLPYPGLVNWVDKFEPWNKQHIMMMNGPNRRYTENWMDPRWVSQHLEDHDVDELLNAYRPLILPELLELTSIQTYERKIRVLAIEKREYLERNQLLDQEMVTDDGNDVEMRAYVKYIKRGHVTFEWDLESNDAFLQISQLPRRNDYTNVYQSFRELVYPWLDLNLFGTMNLSPVISRLHEIEEGGDAFVRSYSIDYSSIQGRRVSGRGPSTADSLLGEHEIDEVMRSVRDYGIGHLGNFYWLPDRDNPYFDNPLEGDVHIFILGTKGRVAFPAQNREEDVRYVLSTVRSLGN